MDTCVAWLISCICVPWLLGICVPWLLGICVTWFILMPKCHAPRTFSATHLQQDATPLNAQIQCAYVMCIGGTYMWVCDRHPSTCRHPLKRTSAHIWYVHGICHHVIMCEFARKKNHVKRMNDTNPALTRWHGQISRIMSHICIEMSHITKMHANEACHAHAWGWVTSDT